MLTIYFCREKNEMTQEAQRLITTIQQMEASLGDERANGQYELNRGDLKVTYPLNRCIAFLREKNDAMSRLHRERFEQVKSECTLYHWPLNRPANCKQNLSTPLSPTLPTLRSRFFPSNCLLLPRDRPFLPVSIYPLTMSPHWTLNSAESTKSTTDAFHSSRPLPRRSSSCGLSLEPPKCRQIRTSFRTIANLLSSLGCTKPTLPT